MMCGSERKGETVPLRHMNKSQMFSSISQSVSQPCVLSEQVTGRNIETGQAHVKSRKKARDLWFCGWGHLGMLLKHLLSLGMLLVPGFPGGSVIKEFTCQCRRCGFDTWSEGSPGGGNGNSLQYSCLENSMDRGAWWATVHRVAKNWTPLSDSTTTTSSTRR